MFIDPAGGDPVGISCRCLMLIKLEWLGYRMVKKLWQYVKPFSSNTGTSRTDGRTELLLSISRVSVLTRDKNSNSRSVLAADRPTSASCHWGIVAGGGRADDVKEKLFSDVAVLGRVRLIITSHWVIGLLMRCRYPLCVWFSSSSVRPYVCPFVQQERND